MLTGTQSSLRHMPQDDQMAVSVQDIRISKVIDPFIQGTEMLRDWAAVEDSLPAIRCCYRDNH